MSASARDLLVRGKAAAKAGDVNEARFYLEWVLRTDASRRQRIEAWYWLAEISSNPAEKRDCLENILAHEPGHAEARRSLAILDGRLKPEDIIDPNRAPTDPAAEPARPIQTEQFTCPRCNGQMRFNPNDQSLSCPYCQHHLSLAQAQAGGQTVEEQDFFVALATAKGHSRPVATQTFQCQGCGVSFVVGPAVLSLTCPYCASAHVIKEPEERPLIPPQGIAPFVLTREQARHKLQSWLGASGLHRAQTAVPHGLYLPVWTFDVGGEIGWREKTGKPRHNQANLSRQYNSRPIFYDDVLVPASKKFTNLAAEFEHYRLDQLVPFEPGYLADWPAETYQLAPSDASLVARDRAYDRARREIINTVTGPFTDSEELAFSSAGIVISSFKLILLPVWIGYYILHNKRYNAVINGQTGHLKAARPKRRGGRWWEKLAGKW